MKSRDEDLDVVFYCTKCYSLDIRTDKKGCMYCHHCGADVYNIDATTLDVWDNLYQERYGGPLLEKKSIYDDLSDAYQDDASVIMTPDEALSNGMLVSDVINRRIKD